VAEPKRRTPARDSTRIGTAAGLHLPGILPEPDVIEAQDGDWTSQEQALLDDLDRTLPAEDHEAPVGDNGTGAGTLPVELTRQRAQLPWWYGSLFFAGAALSCFGAAWFAVPLLQRAIFLVAGVAFVWFAGQSWRSRKRKR
jgi:hypothetical protein